MWNNVIRRARHGHELEDQNTPAELGIGAFSLPSVTFIIRSLWTSL